MPHLKFSPKAPKVVVPAMGLGRRGTNRRDNVEFQ